MKIKYQESITAFIDVLGFSELVYSSDLTKLEAYFNSVTSNFRGRAQLKRIKHMVISDSVILTTKDTLEDLAFLVILIQELQVYLLRQYGIIIRGAISCGNLYINKTNNVIVGDSLIKAYHLEQTAKYPRVVLSRELILKFGNDQEDFIHQINNRITDVHVGVNKYNAIKTDDSETDLVRSLYINYAEALVSIRQFSLKGHSAKVYDLIKKNIYNSKNADKYLWLKLQIIGEINNRIAFLKSLPKLDSRQKKQIVALEQWLIGFESL